VSHRRDFYEILEVTPSATTAEMRASFRRLARQWHPDANGGSRDAEREFKRISRAWETLGDPGRREIYDRRHSQARFAGPGGGGQASFTADDGQFYHGDLGHHSDFYQAGDPLSVADAAELTGRHPDVLRRAIRDGRLAAVREGNAYLLRRRDVERLDLSMPRRRSAASS
jgi:excisionase family DNA binding protein